MKTYQDILIDMLENGVCCITLNRPEARNALRTQLLAELSDALNTLSFDDSIRCVVLTGGEKVFAAGADVAEMANMGMMDIMQDERPKHWASIAAFPKPVVNPKDESVPIRTPNPKYFLKVASVASQLSSSSIEIFFLLNRP